MKPKHPKFSAATVPKGPLWTKIQTFIRPYILFKYRQNTYPILVHLKKYRPQWRWNWCIVAINMRVPPAPIAWYFVCTCIVVVYYTCFMWQELRLNKAKPNLMPCFGQKLFISRQLCWRFQIWKNTYFLLKIQT